MLTAGFYIYNSPSSHFFYILHIFKNINLKSEKHTNIFKWAVKHKLVSSLLIFIPFHINALKVYPSFIEEITIVKA